jgi:membrane associated rhomboid family serine protease
MAPRSSMPMGNFALPPFTRGVKWLLIATVALSILVPITGAFGETLARTFAFIPGALLHGFVWQPFTYTFLNPDPLGIIFAALGLWLMGGSLEAMWGTRRFVTFYFATSVVAALATAVIGLFFGSVARYAYFGNFVVLEALAAAFAVTLPSARIFLYFVPIEARLLLPLSAGITLLFVIFHGPTPYLPQIFALGTGVLFAGGVRTPRQVLLRLKVWWIDRRLRSRRLRVVRGEDDLSGHGRSGSDKYLH